MRSEWEKFSLPSLIDIMSHDKRVLSFCYFINLILSRIIRSKAQRLLYKKVQNTFADVEVTI